MNGCFFFLLILYIFYVALRARIRSEVGPLFWKAALTALGQRDYLLTSLSCETTLESKLREILVGEVRAGTIRSKDLEAFASFQDECDRLADEGLRLLWSYAAHLGFVLLVPSLTRCLVLGRFWSDRRDFLEIALVLLFVQAGLVLLAGVWPVPPLGRARATEDFVRAYLGQVDCGAFAGAVDELNRRAWADGLDDAAARKAMLRDWYLSELARCKARLATLETALGPVELIASALFAVLLLGWPLLSHFSGLLKP